MSSTDSPDHAPGEERRPRRFRIAGLAALVALAVAVPLSCRRAPTGPRGEEPERAQPEFVGTAACKECHAAAYEAWRGSDHERAMMPATSETVLGDFDDATFTGRGKVSRFFRRDGKFLVATEGPGGEPGEFEIAYTFGVRPLQQYLVPFPGGRMQALPIAWDTERKRWFDLNPNQEIAPSDWLHWTRNGQNWNGMCAECHSTNLRKSYDPKASTYATTWTDINVGCEACHGPGSRHVAWGAKPGAERSMGQSPADRGLVVSTRELGAARTVELCAPCHSRRAELWDDDHRGGPLLDTMLPSLLAEGLYAADGQQLDEVYTYGSFVQSRMYAKGVHCVDCHDPHRAELRAPGNAGCVRCHNAAGAALRAGIDGSGLKRNEYDSPAHHFHRAGGPGSACVDCHAPPRTYMVVDPRHDHSFRIPRPDLTPTTGAPNACNGCHADRTSDWAATTVARWYGADRRRERHYGETLAAGRQGSPGAAAALRALATDPTQATIVRATALDLLRGDPDAETARVLSAALAEAEPLLRQVAAGALESHESVAPRERSAALAPLLADPVRAVRLAALSALAGTPRELLAPDRQRAFDLALSEYEAAMSRSLDFASSAFNLGNLHAKRGEPLEAEREYRRALAIDDLFLPAKSNLAVLLSGQGRNEEAEGLLREMVRDAPGDADAARSLGLLLVEMERPEEGAELLERAIAAAPREARTRYNLGLLLQQLGRVEEAEAQLVAALELEPENPDFLLALADHLLRRGRPELALALARRLRAAHPELAIGPQLEAAAERALAAPGGKRP